MLQDSCCDADDQRHPHRVLRGPVHNSLSQLSLSIASHQLRPVPDMVPVEMVLCVRFHSGVQRTVGRCGLNCRAVLTNYKCTHSLDNRIQTQIWHKLSVSCCCHCRGCWRYGEIKLCVHRHGRQQPLQWAVLITSLGTRAPSHWRMAGQC